MLLFLIGYMGCGKSSIGRPLAKRLGLKFVDMDTEIERRCGVRHSVRAVEMRASRIHCSLAVQTVCPSCGAVGVKINRQTGMCRRCTEEYHLAQERAFNEQLERERVAAEEAADIDDVRRERDMMRQRNSRLCRKYGLKGKRERK